MPVRLAAFVALLTSAFASQAETCETIKSQIDAKLRSGGVSTFQLDIVDAGAASTGRVIGTCGMGSKRILYSTTGSNPPVTTSVPSVARSITTSSKPVDENMLTECKPGYSGPDCKKFEGTTARARPQDAKKSATP